MQVELSMQDECLQTSPREDDKKNDNVHADDVVPHVADKIVDDIVQTMPIEIPTATQKTITETVTTVDQVTQTTPRSEGPSNVQMSHSDETEPYEINIETSFVIPDSKIVQEPSGTPTVFEIRKTYVIDESHPGNVREIESKTKENSKKSKSKKKKKQTADKRPDSDVARTYIDPASQARESESSVQVEQPEQKPAVATIKITKTTVYETSSMVGREARPHSSSVRIEEVMSDENADTPLSPGKIKGSSAG